MAFVSVPILSNNTRNYLIRCANIFGMWALTSGSIGCGTEAGSPNIPHGVEAGENVDVIIGQGSSSVRVLSYRNYLQSKELLTPDIAVEQRLIPMNALRAPGVEPRPSLGRSRQPWVLLVGFPIRLLGSGQSIGGVLTKVSDPESTFYGGLKASQLRNIPVRPFVNRSASGTLLLTFYGCTRNCDETSLPGPVLSIPILAVDRYRQELVLDISAVGEGLKIETVLGGGINQYVEEDDTQAVYVDYSTNILVFDVQSRLRPLDASGERIPDIDPIFATTRWYIADDGAFDSSYAVREPVPELGYFLTRYSRRRHIERFSASRLPEADAPVHYYIKNVPNQFKPAFAKGFDDWNIEFYDLLGYNLLSYEFIDLDDPQNSSIVAGDPRVNVLEWDLNNKASYGGLGPHIAHGATGQVISGISLIQGPTILEIYSNWFNVHEQARSLRAEGKIVEAEKHLVEAHRALMEVETSSAYSTRMTIGPLVLDIPSVDPKLADPIVDPLDFFETPPGIDYETYMEGYFNEIVSHELGHNLGLRHNFMGSLLGNEDASAPSSSVMEYVIRPQRLNTRVSAYDVEAIAYGYTGAYQASYPYCTDGQQGSFSQPNNSAECSINDAGPDAFESLRNIRVTRAIDLVIGRGLGGEPPVWTFPDVAGQLYTGLQGMLVYALSAPGTLDSWYNWGLDGDRPLDVDGVRDYVIDAVREATCNQDIMEEVERKYSLNPEAGRLARNNWEAISSYAELVAETVDLPLGPCLWLEEIDF